MGSVTNLAEKRKIRSCEAATQNIPLMPIVSQDDTDDTYIFSKKIDKSIDGCIPYVLFFRDGVLRGSRGPIFIKLGEVGG